MIKTIDSLRYTGRMSNEHEQQLRQLLHVFLEENAKINLSALRTEEQCWIGNIQDSLAVLNVLPSLFPEQENLHILDMGTGGGFPLLPLAICLPNAQLTGLDSTNKKLEAIKRIQQPLGLKNVTLLAGRAEGLGQQKEYRETFDVVMSRAVASLSTLLEYCSPFVKPKGYVVVWKSLHAEEEFEQSKEAQRKLQLQFIQAHTYTLTEPYGQRQLLIFRKNTLLPKLYPRAVGVPKKEPLR